MDETESRFRWQVDVPATGAGLQQIPEMLDWCEHRFNRNDWDIHGHNSGRRPYLARFYFTTENDASAFREKWSPEPSADESGAARPNQSPGTPAG
jgi:hypothetical protein